MEQLMPHMDWPVPPAKVPTVRLRLAGLCLTALLGSVLVLWASRTTWGRVESLQREFAGLKADNFYLGVRMRGEMQRLNETLLRYRLRGETNDAERLPQPGAGIQAMAGRDRHARGDAAGAGVFSPGAEAAYGDYLAESLPLLQSRLGWLKSTQAREFKSSYEKVQMQSRRLLKLCDSFVDDQRASFGDFLKRSQGTLTQFQQLLQISPGAGAGAGGGAGGAGLPGHDRALAAATDRDAG